MKLLITSPRHEGGEWCVWCGLDEVGADPSNDLYGFVIGAGRTRDEAVAQAVAELEAATEELQAPPGVVEERVEDL